MRRPLSLAVVGLALALASGARAERVVESDDIVLGAGPGGIAYAIAQKQAHPDRKVTVLEARPLPRKPGDPGDGGATPWGTLPRVFTVVEGLKNDNAFLGLDASVDEPLARRTEEYLDGRREVVELDAYQANPEATRRAANLEEISFGLNSYYDFKVPATVGSDALAARTALNKFRRGTVYAGDYQRALYQRARALGVEFVFDAPVVAVEAGADGPVSVTRDGVRFAAKNLVIATGAAVDIEELVGIKSEKVAGRGTHIIASVVRRQANHEISLLRNRAPEGSTAKDLGMVMLEMEARTGVLIEVAPEQVDALRSPAALKAHATGVLGKRGVTDPDFEVEPVMFSNQLYRATEYSKKIGGPDGSTDNVFVIGDKARTTHPFTGLGAAYAVRDGILLATHLAEITRVGVKSRAARELVTQWQGSMSYATEQLHQTAYHTFNNVNGAASLKQVQVNGFFSFEPVALHYEPVQLKRSSEKYQPRARATAPQVTLKRLSREPVRKLAGGKAGRLAASRITADRLRHLRMDRRGGERARRGVKVRPPRKVRAARR